MTLFSMDKLARAEAVVEAYVSANRGRSPDHPAYLMHLLWAESRRSGNFKWALIRVACRLVAERAIPKTTSPERVSLLQTPLSPDHLEQ